MPTKASAADRSAFISKKDIKFLWVFFLLLVLFFPDLFLAKTAPLIGDHWEQHFPWASLLAESVSHFKIPFWTGLIQCGFPIAAEGQIGAFYPVNLILYFFLPLRWAYAYLSLIHFFLAGLGTYLYSRRMKLEPLAALVACCVFVFGSASAGAYYNITSLKTLAWFPFALLFFEGWVASGEKKNLIGLSLALALAILAGYLQIAVLMLGIFLAYAILRLFFFRDAARRAPLFREYLPLVAALAAGCLVAAPQILLTYPLAMVSNRAHLAEDYAYVGSMSPAVVLTLFFPRFLLLLRENCLYSGLFGFFLILYAAMQKRKDALFRVWTTIGALCFLLALGRWSPLYVLLIKLTKFYAFRIPAKLIVFVSFSLAVLSGLGFQQLKSSLKTEGGLRSVFKTRRLYLTLFCLMSAGYAVIYFFLTAGRPLAIETGRWFVTHFVYATAGHPYSLEEYFAKLSDVLSSWQGYIRPLDPRNLFSFFLTGLSFLLIYFLPKGRPKRRGWLLIAFAFLLVDLYAYSWMDIRRDFDTYEHALRSDPVLERLKEEKNSGRLTRLYGFRGLHEYLPTVPSFNMIYGIEDIGAYSPFVFKRYFESIGRLGNVNDSNLAASPTAEFVLARLPLLNFLDVSHLLSAHPLNRPNLKFLATEDQYHSLLYLNLNEHARAYFVSAVKYFPDWESLRDHLMQPDFDPKSFFLLEEGERDLFLKDASSVKSGGPISVKERTPSPSAIISKIKLQDAFEHWQIQTEHEGFFVVSNLTACGWSATANGKAVPIVKGYGLFKAVWISGAGKYDIRFRYSPFSRGCR